MTREGLRDGSLLKAARSQIHSGLSVRSDGEIRACLHETLARRPTVSPIWVFGYGSLIFNPAIRYVEKRNALLRGWRRRFCLTSGGRGSAEQPGIMLALDSGGSCQGVAFRLDEATLDEELGILWHREMLTDAYRPCWMNAYTAQGPIPVLTFVANRKGSRFVGHLNEGEIVSRIAFACGAMGSCLDYFRNTIAALEECGIRDSHLEGLRQPVDAALVKALGETVDNNPPG
jgi:cation transport protein ChaC